MSSAVKLILGVSVLAMTASFVACDNGSSDTGTPPITVGGGGNSVGTAGASSVAGAPQGAAGAPVGGGGAPAGTAGSAGAAPGAGAPSTAGAAGGAVLPEGIPLTPTDGWVDVASNTLMVQGAVFPFGDDTSKMGMVSNFVGTDKACIMGTAAKVDLTCTPVLPATDCYGQFWGAAIGMNLNQPIDMTLVPPAGGTPMPFNATALKGFAFEVEGNTVPAPSAFRFKVEDATTEFCNIPTVKIKNGVNTVLFTDLVKECYKSPTPTAPLADTAKAALIKISWQVVTNTSSSVPFDFCISNVRALM